MDDPGLIGIAGDWHGNTRWGVSAVRQICSRLEGEKQKIILQAGDFGVWHPPGDEVWTFAGVERSRQSYLSAIEEVLSDNNAELWFCDGNHEDHPLLARLLADSDPYGQITPRVRYLNRGSRWKWHERTWLACGGAVSIDKLQRTPGIGWFPEEAITPEQEAVIAMMGEADVLLSHDAPADAPLILSPRHQLPEAWKTMLPECEAHREVLQRICMSVKPSYVFHGHYHTHSVKTIHAIWGKCRFTALDCDGTQFNWGILDTRTMDWEWLPGAVPSPRRRMYAPARPAVPGPGLP